MRGLPASGCQLPAVSFPLSAFGCRLPAVGFPLSASRPLFILRCAQDEEWAGREST